MMSDDALIRLENLKKLGLGPADLKREVGSSYQYWKDLLAGNKSFGEKIARKIEEALGLVRGSLDMPGFTRSASDAANQNVISVMNPADGTAQNLEKTLAYLAEYLNRLEGSDKKEAMRQIATLVDEPERHAKIAAAIEAMAKTAFAQGGKRVA